MSSCSQLLIPKDITNDFWYDSGISTKNRSFGEYVLNGRVYVFTDNHFAHKQTHSGNSNLVLFSFIIKNQAVIGRIPEKIDARIDTTDEISYTWKNSDVNFPMNAASVVLFVSAVRFV